MKNLPIGSKAPDVINVVIEIPAGSHNKYEFDEELNAIKLDRVQPTTMAQPCDYGFIPETRSDDGDHLDALIVIDNPLFPGCVVAARPIGLLKMVDGGEGDEKIICVAAADKMYEHITELDQLSPLLPKRIQHYFEHYKDLQNKKVEITGWGNAAEARAEIEKSIKTFQTKS